MLRLLLCSLALTHRELCCAVLHKHLLFTARHRLYHQYLNFSSTLSPCVPFFFLFSPLSHVARVLFGDQFDKAEAVRRAGVHAEWVMSPHQLLPESNNWAWAVATQPALLALVRKHLVWQ